MSMSTNIPWEKTGTTNDALSLPYYNYVLNLPFPNIHNNKKVNSLFEGIDFYTSPTCACILTIIDK